MTYKQRLLDYFGPNAHVLWVWHSTLISRFVANGTQFWWTAALLIFSDDDGLNNCILSGDDRRFHRTVSLRMNTAQLCLWVTVKCLYRDWQSIGQLLRLASNYLGLHQTTRRSITPMCRDITTCQSTCRFDNTPPPDAYGNAISENTPLRLQMVMSSSVNHPSQSILLCRDETPYFDYSICAVWCHSLAHLVYLFLTTESKNYRFDSLVESIQSEDAIRIDSSHH